MRAHEVGWDWDEYLARFHRERPGITERALLHARDPDVGTAYDWLLSGLPGALGVLLDVACGSAPLREASEGRRLVYIGVDRSEAEVAQAHHRGRTGVVVADARALPVASASVDTVLSSLGLMLVRPLDAALREIARVLRPGGRLALLLPARRPVRLRELRTVLALNAALGGAWDMPEQLTPRRLAAQLEQSGLTLVEARRRRFPFPLRSPDDAGLAVASLYTPGRTQQQLAAAERTLVRRQGPRAELPLPLLRVTAQRG